MAGETQAEIEQDEDQIEGQEAEQEETAAEGETESEDGEASESAEETDDGEVVVTIGEESPPEEEEERRAPEWVRELRKSNREKDRVIREREAEIQRLKGSASQPAAVTLGAKPTLESCDYDAEKFEQELESWHDRKLQIDQQKKDQEQAEAQAKTAWQAKLDSYGKAKGALKVKDYDDAEGIVQDMMNLTQQGIILQGADNPATLVYALGKNPKKAKELSTITDPVKFAFAIAKLETQLKVVPRKSAPVPERQVRSSVAGAAAVDNQLAKLQAEADKTGDRSKVARYLREKSLAKRG